MLVQGHLWTICSCFFPSSLFGIISFIISSVYVCDFTVLFFMRLPGNFPFLWVFPENRLINIPINTAWLSSLINFCFYLQHFSIGSTFHKVINKKKCNSFMPSVIKLLILALIITYHQMHGVTVKYVVPEV